MESETPPEHTTVHIHHASSHFTGAHNFTIGQQYNIAQQSIMHYHGSMGLLDLLQPIPDASHIRNRKISPPDAVCLDGTRRAVLKQATSWIDSGVILKDNPSHILWLYGSVGCGKSAIAQTLADTYAKKKRLLASFFFFRGSGHRSTSAKFAATLASQLAASIPATAPLIEGTLKTHAGLLTTCPLALQFQYLFLDPFQAAFRNPARLAQTLLKGSYVVVIDGLDECDNPEEVVELINQLLRFFKENPRTPLRFFISSRVEEHIRTRLADPQVQLVNLVAHASFEDILFVVNETFNDAAKHDRVIQAYGNWPTQADRRLLAEHADGSFAFMSTILRYILEFTNDGCAPAERLAHTLELNPGLDTLYAHTLARSEGLPHFNTIIRTIALLAEPLSIAQLAELLHIKGCEVIQVMVNLQSIIQVPGDDHSPVTLFHTSLRDFLTTKSRSERFFASPDHHSFLTSQSLSLLYTFYDDLRFRSPSSSDEYPKSYWGHHWRSWLDHTTRCSPEPSRQLRLHLRRLIKQANAVCPEICQVLLPIWTLADRSLLATLGIDVHQVFKTTFKLPQYPHPKSGEQQWSRKARVVASTLTSALAAAVDVCGGIMDVYDEMPRICRGIQPSLHNLPSYHTTLLNLCISRLFPREPHQLQLPGDGSCQKYRRGIGKPEWVEDIPSDLSDLAAARYLFFALPRHLASAAQNNSAFTRDILLGSGPDGTKPRFLFRICHQRNFSDSGETNIKDVEGLINSLAPASGRSWSSACCESLKRDIALASSAIGNLLGGQRPTALVSREDDWGFIESWEYPYDVYASTKGDCSILSVWVGYSNIVQCFIAQQEGVHDTSACTLHRHFRGEGPIV